MNLQKLKFKSIRAKLITGMIALCLIPLLTAESITYLKAKDILAKKLEVTSRQTLSEINLSLDNYFKGTSILLNMASSNVNFTQAYTSEEKIQYAKNYLKEMQSSSTNIMNTFYGTESGKFQIYPEADIPDNFNHKERPWYKLAVNNKGKIVVTPPYKDVATGKIVVTLAKTVEYENNIVGVVGIDLSLDALSDSLSKSKTGETGYVFICDSDGILISHPDKTLIGTDTPAKLSFWNEAKTNEMGFTTYTFEGQKKFANYDTNKLTGFKLIAAINESELIDDLNSIKNLIIVSLGIVSLLASLLALILSKGIAVNIAKLKTAFESASKGDLTTEVIINSEDELGKLGSDFNEMIRNISSLMKNVETSTKTILEASSQIASMSEETTASINEVSRAIEEISQGATVQAHNAQESVSNIDELSLKIDDITAAAKEAGQISNDTQALSDKGLTMVETLSQKSLETKESSSRVGQVVQEVNNSMSKITTISEAISSITEQTNLLALNASIEAARAGEAGRGFAVVAEEIRKLAEESRNSTEEIKKIIETIQMQSNKAVKAMESTEITIKEQEHTMVETRKVFNEIINSVSILTGKINIIKNSIIDINSSKENVVQQTQNISAVAQETASASEEVSASAEEVNATMDELTKYAEELNNLSNKLEKEVNNFKTK
ncbi:methyl-accepting chemotaxis protein [Clostridium sp. SYSU_GA19001]|uniref:methyl-accepting chemotaxis protein n=1 Tax=Clostridium caldaquaticum TaxID=2940653 RepID=UPI0020777E13|nr:methyl-accepting chemotaxis protein [Clostridium caldaquaticum]MCM8710254.1 methyl-accepting chemotaxis protein [Clostridium caldaquaticum]